MSVIDGYIFHFVHNGSFAWFTHTVLPYSLACKKDHAVLLGLLCARSLGVTKLRAEGDSELVVKQVNGLYQVKDSKLRELWGPTRDALHEFDEYHLTHIPRGENKRADWLANHAMDTEASHGFEEE